MRRVVGDLGGPAIEVLAKVTRRRFTVEYKRKIVREPDGCRTPGAVGALLRREGLYTSHLATWRAARDRGELAGVPKKLGQAPQVLDSRDKRIAELEREMVRWRKRTEAQFKTLKYRPAFPTRFGSIQAGDRARRGLRSAPGTLSRRAPPAAGVPHGRLDQPIQHPGALARIIEYAASTQPSDLPTRAPSRSLPSISTQS